MQSLYTSIGNLSLDDFNESEEETSAELQVTIEPENTTVERLTERETKHVRTWRVVVLVLILVACGAVTTSIYFALQDEEKDDKTAAVSTNDGFIGIFSELVVYVVGFCSFWGCLLILFHMSTVWNFCGHNRGHYVYRDERLERCL